ncbi:MAG: hypothetical protein KDE28_27060, partial [Anaerolineales bacterium]|nr:hypothetical protein [Anaerolineales bacterium]
EYGPDFSGQTVSAQIFGDGRDGVMPTSGNLDSASGVGVGTVNGFAGTNTVNVIDAHAIARVNLGDIVLIHQTIGNGAGNWELNIAASDFTGPGSFLLAKPLQHNYITDSINKAQILRVPQYSECSVSGNVTALGAWNGSWGGIFAVMCSENFDLSGSINVNGIGYRGGELRTTNVPDMGHTGEGYPGNYNVTDMNCWQTDNSNGNGGGAGHGYVWVWDSHKKASGGGGGGHQTNGETGHGPIVDGWCSGKGGKAVGDEALTTAYFGGGGGGGGTGQNDYEDGGQGGDGAGIAFVFAKTINISATGSITANGTGGRGALGSGLHLSGGGGGGAGGAIYLLGSDVNLGTAQVAALGGNGGPPNSDGAGGGNGSAGRIRIEYCNALTGTTSPLASEEKITCYILRQLPGTPNTELVLPEPIIGSARFHIQYGQRSQFAVAGTQTFSVILPKQSYNALSVDALFQNLGNANFTFSLDVGADGSVEWNGNGTEQPLIISSPNANALAAGLNAYLATTPEAWGTAVSIPIEVTLDTSGDVFLTNLSATPGLNADAGAGAISFSNNSPTEGEAITVQVDVSNTAVLSVSNIVVSFFAGDPDQGGVYLGADFVPEIQAGGSVVATLDWNTTSFVGDIDLYAVLDLADQVAETDENNNRSLQTVSILSRPDLQATSWDLSDPEPLAGELVEINVNLLNAGQTASGAATYGLYNGNPENGGILLDSQTHSGLGGNSSDAITLSWLPTAPGPYQLFLRLDEDDTVNEFDEANNLLWQDLYVGLAGPVLLDSGVMASDPAYSATIGYGYVDTGLPDVLQNCGSSAPEDTLRRDPDGSVNYRFTHLQPGHFYHLDITLFECDGIGRQESILVDGHVLAGPEDLGGGTVHRLTLRLDPALYADRTIDVSITVPGAFGAVVSAVNLHDVDYRYADAGGNMDPAYGPNSDYGWLDGLKNTSWGTLPYQSVRVNQDDGQVSYQFDNLDPNKRYRILLTFWQGDGAALIQKVRIDGLETGLTVDSGDYLPHEEQISVPLGSYANDGSIIVSIVRLNANFGAMVNEIALEEETLASVVSCEVQTTPYFSQVYGNVALTGVSAPPGTVVQAISPRGDVVGCFTVNSEGIYGFMRIYGEDGSANPPIPGMRAGELVSFKVSGSPAVATPLFYWQDDKASHPVDLNAESMEGQFILLSPGWNWLSLNLEPPTPLVAQVYDSINGRYDRVLGESGIYDTSLPPVFNSLTEIHGGLGYMIRITETASVNLLVEGVSLPVTTPIPLHQGWNWVGYVPTQTLPIETALQSIAGQYQLVLGQDGTYDPDLPAFSTLQEMSPGNGYMIYANAAITLTYPSPTEAFNSPQTVSAIVSLPQTPYFTIVYGQVTLNGQPAPPGTVIEAMTPRGDIAGRFVIEQPG